MFWYSLLCVHKRDFLLREYSQIGESIKDFHNIVVKKFDWENYIYKCVLGAQYVKDNTNCDEDRNRYYDLIVENLDVYNYMIKYEVFRNDKFIINILDIIDDRGLAKVLKAKIKDRPDLGKDERYGRRVLFEFNKAYPIVMSPMLEKDELEVLFKEYLGYYYDLSGRYGRRVLFEFNKAYPIVMSPMLEKDELEVLFKEYLGYYYDLSGLECVVV